MLALLMLPEVMIAVAVFGALALAVVVTSPGEPISEPTLLSDDGTVVVIRDGELQPADPTALAKGMGMDPGAYALARVIESEGSGLPRNAQVGIAWTVLNHAREAGLSVVDLVTRAKIKQDGDRVDGAGAGYFGKQGDPAGGYRFVTSAQDSTEDSRAIAQAVADGDEDDITGGAVNFDSPQSYGAQDGTEEGGGDTFAENRKKEGKVEVDLPGVSSSRVRFWRYL